MSEKKGLLSPFFQEGTITNKSKAGVYDNAHNQVLEFWPTGIQGYWPEPWFSLSPSLHRQKMFKVLSQLIREYQEKHPSRGNFPLGKNTHEIDLVNYMHAPRPGIIGVVIRLETFCAELKALPGYSALEGCSFNNALHLGFVPKLNDKVSIPVWTANTEGKLHTGRILLINNHYKYGEDKSKRAVTIKVAIPYGEINYLANPMTKTASRMNTTEIPEDKDVKVTVPKRRGSLRIEED